MEEIAIRTRVFPKWMLSDCGNWTGFERVPSVDGSVGGMYSNERFLFLRCPLKAANHPCPYTCRTWGI